MVWTDISVLSVVIGAIGANVTPENRITIKKINIKSLETLPPIKDTISNQYKNNFGLKKYQSLPPHVPKFPSGFKSLRNKANDDNPESTDTSHNYRDDMSPADWDDYIGDVKSMKNTNEDDAYK